MERNRKEVVSFLKAAKYLRLLDLNFRNLYVQGRLDSFLLPLNLSMRGKGSYRLFFLSIVCSVKNNIFFNQLVRKESLFPFVGKLHKKFRFSRFFEDEFDKGFYGNLNVNSVSSLYRFNNRVRHKLVSQRYFSLNSHVLKLKFNKKTQKFENIFSLISSVENLQEVWHEIKSKSENLILDDRNLEWFKKVSDKLKSGFYEYKQTRQVIVNKFNKDNKKPLTTCSPCDNLVQKAIFRILQQVYEGISF